VGAVALSAAALTVVGASPAAAVQVCNAHTPALGATVTCAFAGTDSVTVPANAGTVTVSVIGAGGGSGAFQQGQSRGGSGAALSGTVTLPAGTTSISVQVGQGGSAGVSRSDGGQGGGGGGASGLAAVGAGAPVPLVIAGGGGGSGGTDVGDVGPLVVARAEAAPLDVPPGTPVGDGGNAGLLGAAAGDGNPGAEYAGEANPGGGGGGANGAVPGAAGSNVDGTAPLTPATAGQGPATAGAGGTGSSDSAGRHGANGGSGYAGGGGGGNRGVGANSMAAGGGGGGSSFADPVQAAGLTSALVTAAGPGFGALGADGTGATAVAGLVTLTFNAAVTVPGAPTNLNADAVPGGMTLTFTPPADDGGSPITKYQVSLDGGAWTDLPTTSAGGQQHATLGGLTNGHNYTVDVRAVNAVGPGDAVETTCYVSAPPSAPANLVATPHDSSVTLTFATPADNGSAIDGYQYSIDNGVTWLDLPTTGTTTQTGTVTGLTNGTAYTFVVRATSENADGAASTAATATPATIPGAPTITASTGGNGTAIVTFTAPASNGGSAITGYDYSLDGGATWLPLTFTGTGPYTGTVTGLTNGTTEQVSLRARNGVGPGPASSATPVTPQATTPGPVQDLQATPTAAGVDLTFGAPADDGGSAVLGYQYSLDGGTTWLPLATSGTGPFTASISGLAPGTSYTVEVRAVNALGSGPETPAAPVTPTAPTTPTTPSSTASSTPTTTGSTTPTSTPMSTSSTTVTTTTVTATTSTLAYTGVSVGPELTAGLAAILLGAGLLLVLPLRRRRRGGAHH
jgi:hypothetical protein